MTPAVLLLYCAAAWVFVTLTIEYGRARRRASTKALGALALVFSVSFVLQLAAWFTLSPRAAAAAAVVSAFLAPLVLHTAGGPRSWLIAAYLYHPLLALARELVDAGVASFEWPIDPAKLQLAGWTFTSLGALIASVRFGRHWLERAILGAIVLICAASFVADEPWFALAPDYFLLAYFCVALYHRERLLFFDVFFRRAAYLAGGLTILLIAQPLVTETWAWAAALAFWALAPLALRWADALVEGHLRRRHTADAEERFLRDLQSATSEEELIRRAEQALSEIFETRARLAADAHPAALSQAIAVDGQAQTQACLDARPGSRPFFSRDRELLGRLCRTLGIVWENLRVRESERELRLLASRAELKALRAQINPHFLFNSLNAIGGLIHTNPALADELVEKLADVFRYTLRQSEEEWIPFPRERDFIESYLAIERGRFGPRLQISQHIPPDADTCWLPAMMVQPLIENAIKHGAARHPSGGELEWSAVPADGVLTIRIADNGPGTGAEFLNEPKPGHALHNIARRLQGYFGGDGHLQAVREDHRTVVTLTIPQEHRHAHPHRG